MLTSENIPLSYLSQYGYCRRRAGMLLLDQVWQDNEYTAEGNAGHEHVHNEGIEKRKDIIKLKNLVVVSNRLGIQGKCDCVELHADVDGVHVPYAQGLFKIYPIEYKHGVQRDENEYNIQLCAQAMCLEEMTGAVINEGAIFYIDAHRRFKVSLTSQLREQVISGSADLHNMLSGGIVPNARYTAKCKKCSLNDYCAPRMKRSALEYNKNVIKIACSEEDTI